MRRRPHHHPAESSTSGGDQQYSNTMRDVESGDEDEPLTTTTTSSFGHRSQNKNKPYSRSFNTRRRMITIGGVGSLVLLVVILFARRNSEDATGRFKEGFCLHILFDLFVLRNEKMFGYFFGYHIIQRLPSSNWSIFIVAKISRQEQ